MNFLIALIVNLVGMLVIYSWMAFALVQLRWRGHGGGAAILAILVAGQFWIVVPLFVRALSELYVPAGALWLGNWLVSGFSVVILCQSARWIPRELGDSARLDGCGWIGTYRHVVFPLVRRELGLIAFLTLMATATLFWIARSASGTRVPPWLHLLLPMGLEHGPGLTRTLLTMIGGSLVVTLPLFVIFFLSKGWFLRSAKLETD
jgi:ABC-type glycerol-3-phosphate transport system permease component